MTTASGQCVDCEQEFTGDPGDYLTEVVLSDGTVVELCTDCVDGYEDRLIAAGQAYQEDRAAARRR